MLLLRLLRVLFFNNMQTRKTLRETKAVHLIAARHFLICTAPRLMRRHMRHLAKHPRQVNRILVVIVAIQVQVGTNVVQSILVRLLLELLLHLVQRIGSIFAVMACHYSLVVSSLSLEVEWALEL